MITRFITEGDSFFDSIFNDDGDEVLIISRELVDGSAAYGADFISSGRFVEVDLLPDEGITFEIETFDGGVAEGLEAFFLFETIEYEDYFTGDFLGRTSQTVEFVIEEYDGQFADTLLDFPDDTTGVVAATYQFFTGSIPTADGFIFLIDSEDNSADLTDSYYDVFNQENRFINFASNLGLYGSGADEFDDEYGSLSFEGTIRKAYDEIVGFDNAEAAGNDEEDIVDFFLDARSFYEAVARERVLPGTSGVSLDDATKVVAIGSILNEAVKSGLGTYAEAYEDFLDEVNAETADFNVNLLAAYNSGEFFAVG